MATIPQDILDLLNAAEEAKAGADAADDTYDLALERLSEATDVEEEAKDDLLEAQAAALVAANAAIDAIKAHFGIGS